MNMSLQTKNNPTHHLLFQAVILSACLKYYPADGRFFTLNFVCSIATKICTYELKWMLL